MSDRTTPFTSLNEIGEFNLIEQLTKNFSLQNSNSILGVGDDAALIDVGDIYQVVSNDLLTEGVHFDLSYHPLKHLGYKSIVVNLSDIAAMNATPQQVLVGLAISNQFSLEALKELYEGIHLACQRYQVDLVGGDTVSTSGGLVLSVTAIGNVKKALVCKRSGAKSKDIIAVTGDLGAAYVGLQVLVKEKQVFEVDPKMQPDLTPYSYLIERQLKPEARTDIVKSLYEVGCIPNFDD